jgi:menaquinone-9 beta-reductase
MAESFDVVVVGARCAGSPLATMLANKGLRVCVVDKDTFPSDTLSTHGIQPIGVQVFQKIGVFDELTKVAPPMTHGIFAFEDDRMEVPDVTEIAGAPLLSVRRPTLDEILAKAAAEAGADVRTGTNVTELINENGRVAGVKTADGELRASLVVGADGTRSSVAKMVGAKEYQQTPNGRVFMWGYWEGVDPTSGGAWIGKIDDYAYLVTPCDAGLVLVAACPSIDRRDEVRARRDEVYEEGLRGWPALLEGLAGGKRVGSLYTMANMHGFFRESAGPGWVLVGDAGHFKDPTPGQGIADALRQGERLAADIERGLAAGPEETDSILRDWWRWRDEDAWEMYWFAHDVGAAGPTPPVLREIQRRIASDPELAEGMVHVFNHDRRPSEVFKPGLALRSIARAFMRGRGERGAVLREAGSVFANRLRRGSKPRGKLKARARRMARTV